MVDARQAEAEYYVKRAAAASSCTVAQNDWQKAQKAWNQNLVMIAEMLKDGIDDPEVQRTPDQIRRRLDETRSAVIFRGYTVQ